MSSHDQIDPHTGSGIAQGDSHRVPLPKLHRPRGEDALPHLGHEDVRRTHTVGDVIDEAEHKDRSTRFRLRPPEESAAQPIVAPAHDDELPWQRTPAQGSYLLEHSQAELPR
jgi:hypothetical protein